MSLSCDDVPLEVSQIRQLTAGWEPSGFVDPDPAAGEGHPRGGHHPGLARDPGHFLHRDGEVQRPGPLRLHLQSGQPH